jgi:HK97 family phage portal protein
MIGLLRRWLGRGEARGLHPRDPALAGWFAGNEAASGMVVTPEAAMRATAVFACVQYLARSIGAMPLLLYRRLPSGGKERDTDHPLARVLHDRPNSWQTAYDFRASLQAHLCLRGNAYARIVSSNGNPAAALIPVHPDRIRPLPERVRGRLAYEYWPRLGGREVLMQEEVLHLRGLSVAEDGLLGLSPIDCMREAVGLALAAESYGARFYRNDARPGVVLKHPGKLSAEAATRLKESWNQRFAGVHNAHRTAVLEEGMEVVTVGMTAEQAQFLETRKFQRSEIAAIFGVPLHKIGDLERATFSNIEHQAIEVVTDTIRPWAVAWEQALERDLFTEEMHRTHVIAFNLDGLLRGDIESRYRAYATGRQWGWLSANDVREREDMNRIDGGDLYLAPVNMTPAEKLASAVGDLVNATGGANNASRD